MLKMFENVKFYQNSFPMNVVEVFDDEAFLNLDYDLPHEFSHADERFKLRTELQKMREKTRWLKNRQELVLGISMNEVLMRLCGCKNFILSFSNMRYFNLSHFRRGKSDETFWRKNPFWSNPEEIGRFFHKQRHPRVGFGRLSWLERTSTMSLVKMYQS